MAWDVASKEHALDFLQRLERQWLTPLKQTLTLGLETERQEPELTRRLTALAEEVAALDARKGAAENETAKAEGHRAEVVARCNREISEAETAHQGRLVAMRDEETAARRLLADVTADLAAARAKLG